MDGALGEQDERSNVSATPTAATTVIKPERGDQPVGGRRPGAPGRLNIRRRQPTAETHVHQHVPAEAVNSNG